MSKENIHITVLNHSQKSFKQQFKSSQFTSTRSIFNIIPSMFFSIFLAPGFPETSRQNSAYISCFLRFELNF